MTYFFIPNRRKVKKIANFGLIGKLTIKNKIRILSERESCFFSKIFAFFVF